MDEVIGLIRDLTEAVREMHAQSVPDNFRGRQLQEKLKRIEARADALLPERPSLPPGVPAISENRPQSEWDALAGRPKPHLVK
jgi:hypothetical protein